MDTTAQPDRILKGRLPTYGSELSPFATDLARPSARTAQPSSAIC